MLAGRSFNNTAVFDENKFRGGTCGGRADSLQSIEDSNGFLCDLAKNDVLAIKMRSGLETQEELRAVRVGSCVGH